MPTAFCRCGAPLSRWSKHALCPACLNQRLGHDLNPHITHFKGKQVADDRGIEHARDKPLATHKLSDLRP